MRFLYTNVILCYLTRDDEAKAQACYRLFQRAKQAGEGLFTGFYSANVTKMPNAGMPAPGSR